MTTQHAAANDLTGSPATRRPELAIAVSGLASALVGFLAMFGAGVWALTGSGDGSKLVSVGADGSRAGKAKKPRRQSPSGGMEDRFRGRFQGR